MGFRDIPILNISQISRITKINQSRLYKAEQRDNLNEEEIAALEKLKKDMENLLEGFKQANTQ